MSHRQVAATTYIVLVPNVYRGSNPEYDSVRSVRVDRVRKDKPKLARGEIALRLRLTFSEQALLDAIPTVELAVGSFFSGPPEPDQAEVEADEPVAETV